ncbi:GTPase domain-containing protein [Thiothrix winogradskyi]|uniref:50S ribosome-binding GTPase n=1 Tax=Thiothrix winogradskyi TaxID=96472 RepID=A0ABY3SYC0_9GAMM|nr:GTPase [Thiothrix winogradskyi]UJS23828.1 50S ribosome-binding GTPase [Thiothrix winogradskyi]
MIASLNNIDDLSLDNVIDKQIIESFENIRSVIFKGISNIKHHLEILSEITEWDKLNVSFFGETNAGKSTVIESLINGDGRSIGEGYKDFTKNVNEIAYKNINLIDMPGIEGREHQVINNIHKAVNKSHIIFYVIGTNKEPEENTISKIRIFLKDNVKVYSIINVRGKPTVYKFKKELKDTNIAIVESRVESKFSELLGKNYSGNIVINGHLALLKNDRIAKSRFANDQIKALEIFANKSEIEKFSNIQEIYTLLDAFEKDVENEIIISNTYKFIKNLSSILSNILREKKNFDSFLKEANGLTEKYLDEVDKVICKYESEILSSLDVNINSMRVELKKTVNKGIDNNDSEISIKSKLDNIREEQSKKLNKNIQKLLSSMKEEIEAKIEEFKNRMSLQMQFLNLKGDFDLGSILESLEINFKYVLGQVLDVGLSIWGVVSAFGINPILGVITGVLVLARKIWDWFFGDPDKRKREAKSEAVSKIDSMINDVKNKIRHDIERELISVQKNTKKPVLQLHESMKGLKKISIAIDDKVLQIKKSQTALSLLLMKRILGDSVTFSYLDLQLSQAIVIGYEVNENVKNYLLKIFRLRKLDLYSSYRDWLNEAGIYTGDEFFLANDEFNFRAANALLSNDNNKFKFKRVKRRSN